MSIRALREAAGMRQYELAARMGVSRIVSLLFRLVDVIERG